MICKCRRKHKRLIEIGKEFNNHLKGYLFRVLYCEKCGSCYEVGVRYY